MCMHGKLAHPGKHFAESVTKSAQEAKLSLAEPTVLSHSGRGLSSGACC